VYQQTGREQGVNVGANNNIDVAQLAFVLDSMAMTNSALGNGVIPPKFAAKRLSFDIEMGQKLIGVTPQFPVGEIKEDKDEKP
jgi:hypothetical protein